MHGGDDDDDDDDDTCVCACVLDFGRRCDASAASAQ